MPAGRPPKPIEEKRRTGNPGRRPLPKKSQTATLTPTLGIPSVPATMVDDEIAIATWHRIWTSEARRWLAPSVDSLIVESICHTTSEIAQLRVLTKTPLLEEPIVSPNGTDLGTRLVANPAVNMLRKAQAQLTKELSDLGFNPTARARLGLAEVKRQSKLEELLSRQSRPTQTGASKDDSEVIDAEIIDIAADH